MDFDAWKFIRLTIIVIIAGFLQNWISKPSNKESKNPNLNKDNITNGDINISRFIIIIIISNIVHTIYAMYMTHQIYGVPIQIMGCGLLMISIIPIVIAKIVCIFKPHKKISNILNAISFQENLSPRKTKLVFALLSLFGLFFTFLHGLIWQHEVEACNFYTYFQSACEMSGEGARTNFSMFIWR